MNSSQIASVARSPSTARQGSPGTRRASANTMNTIPSRTGIVTTIRRRMNWVTAGGHPLQAKMACVASGGAAGAAPPDRMSFAEADGLRGWRVEEAAPQARPVVERAGAALVQRVLGVPLQGIAGDDVVGVERRAVMELHAVAELAGPGLGVGARRALRGQGRHRVGAVIAVQGLVGLLAGPEAFAVGLVGAEQAERLGIAFEHDRLAIGRLHARELLAAEDRRVSAGHIGLVRGSRGAVSDDHGRGVLLDQAVGGRVGGLTCGRVGRRETLVEGIDDVLERGAELLARTRTEVVVEKVRRIRIVRAPADEAETLQGALREAVDHRARLEKL